MVRSVGITAVVLGLAWTGLAGAQSSAPLEKARYLNVSEEGKPPQRCKLLKTWHEANGAPVFQVQAVDSGEMITIVGTDHQVGGDPRAMSTRIFRWGRANKPPAGAPLPPPTAAAWTAPPTQLPPARKTPLVMPQPIRSTPVAATARPTSVPAPVRPAVKPYILTSSKPAPSLTPMSTQVVQYSPASAQGNQLPADPSAAKSQPRLLPLAAGSAGSQKPCNCACPPPCGTCGKPCNPCCQQSCVCGTPSPMRQPLISRLFKSNSSCACTAVACQPPPVPAEQPAVAMPSADAVAKTTEAPKRVDPVPVQMGPSTQPDPLKAPDQYRDMVMNARLANSKIPQEGRPSAISRLKDLVPTRSGGRQPPEMAANAPPPNGGLPPSRVIVISADEPNAFWSPQSPGAGQEKSRMNAFDRQPEPPPQGVPPTIAGVPPNVPTVPPIIPGIMQGPPPQGIVLKNAPCPPTAPMTPPPGPPRPMAPDTGVPDAMSNAFTLAATRRPIPADFGGTPQEPNGFDPPMQMDGSPPRAYGMGMPGTYRPPMPNRAAMGPQAPMAINPLMSVPSMPPNGQYAASAPASARPAGVPQLLAALKDSLCPSERESAAEQLSELNWQVQPLVVESLMKSAREDPAATVRAACVHALAHMKVATPAAVALVRDLKSDRDPRVRQEAEEALSVLGDSGIQQASHK